MKRKLILTSIITGFLFIATSCSKDDDDSPVIVPEANRVETVSGANQSGLVETELANPVEVIVKDQNGNPFNGATVSFSVTDGSVSSVTATSGVNGLVTTNWTLGSISGTQYLTATVFKADGVTPLSGSPLIITATAIGVSCSYITRFLSEPIGPNAGTVTTSIISVGNTFTVTDINVTLKINHTWVGDLDIFLIAPDGITMVELTTDNGGSGDNFVNTVFDDDATISIIDIVNTDAPFTNTYQPEGSLADFNGLNASGDWTLSVTDDSSGDGGEFVSWTLKICGYN